MSDQPPVDPHLPPVVPAPAPGPPALSGVDPRSGLAYATFGQRAGAYLIDVGLLVGAVVVLLVLGVVAGGPLGQTPGKNLLGSKVVGALPGAIGYGRAALRYVGRILDSATCGLPIGLVWAAFDAESRTWHDLIADTRVVVIPTTQTSLGYWAANVRD